ncbi:MAG: hypothetical protein K2W96_04965 [Gemmataceae bacterium]|nr:hypothetical protein [Gemmataceae bacterium]
MDKQEQLETAARKLNIGGYRRHILLCTGPKCCTEAEGMAAWEALKGAIKDKDLGAGENACYRTKVGCLRVCCHGPTAVVYPEGTWYEGITADRVPRLVQEHLVEGRPVEEWVFARNPVGGE